MTIRSQKREAVVELVSASLETPLSESIQTENLVAGPSKNPRYHSEDLDEIKTSDLAKFSAENQKQMLKLMAPTVNKTVNLQNLIDSDPETENTLVLLHQPL